eukprot:SAG31_NODE_1384_length_8578_cov_2.883359_6_plen_151_part_00
MHRPPIFTVKGGTSRTAPLKGNGLPGPNHYSPSRDESVMLVSCVNFAITPSPHSHTIVCKYCCSLKSVATVLPLLSDIGANPRSPMGKAPRMPPPNGFATAVPGPGTYEAHTVNVGSAAPAFSVRPKHAVLAGSTGSCFLAAHRLLSDYK